MSCEEVVKPMLLDWCSKLYHQSTRTVEFWVAGTVRCSSESEVALKEETPLWSPTFLLNGGYLESHLLVPMSPGTEEQFLKVTVSCLQVCSLRFVWQFPRQPCEPLRRR